MIFLSTPSARRATGYPQKLIGLIEFLSTPSARRATQNLRCDADLTDISIHALREEGDTDNQLDGICVLDISIHALREEGDFNS